MGQRLGIAQVGVGVHDADFASEKSAGLGALEQLLGAAAVRQWAVEQARSVGAEQVVLDQTKVRARLLRAEHVFEHGMHHRQQAVANAGEAVAGVQQHLRWLAGWKQRIARDHAARHQKALKIGSHLRRFGFQRGGDLGAPDAAQGARQQAENLVVQGHRPGAAKPLAQGRVSGLK